MANMAKEELKFTSKYKLAFPLEGGSGQVKEFVPGVVVLHLRSAFGSSARAWPKQLEAQSSCQIQPIALRSQCPIAGPE
eukprot:3544939-Amphidinium_carterae.1